MYLDLTLVSISPPAVRASALLQVEIYGKLWAACSLTPLPESRAALQIEAAVGLFNHQPFSEDKWSLSTKPLCLSSSAAFPIVVNTIIPNLMTWLGNNPSALKRDHLDKLPLDSKIKNALSAKKQPAMHYQFCRLENPADPLLSYLLAPVPFSPGDLVDIPRAASTFCSPNIDTLAKFVWYKHSCLNILSQLVLQDALSTTLTSWADMKLPITPRILEAGAFAANWSIPYWFRCRRSLGLPYSYTYNCARRLFEAKLALQFTSNFSIVSPFLMFTSFRKKPLFPFWTPSRTWWCQSTPSAQSSLSNLVILRLPYPLLLPPKGALPIPVKGKVRTLRKLKNVLNLTSVNQSHFVSPTNQIILNHRLPLTVSSNLSPPTGADLPTAPISTSNNEAPGARLSAFLPSWAGAPASTQRILSRGFHWTWDPCPPPLSICNRPNRTSPELLLQVQILTAKGAIYKVPDQPAFISPIFLVPKSTGGWRLILDLSSLNSFIKTPKFRMTNHASLADLLSPPAWMASLDLQDAYLHIPIRPTLHKFLAFRTGTQLWFFKVLPLWSFTSPSSILQNSQVPPFSPPNQRNASSRLSGQLGVLGSNKGSSQPQPDRSLLLPSKSGLADKFPKVEPSPFNRLSLVRSSLASPSGSLGHPSRQNSLCNERNSLSSPSSVSFTATVGSTSWQAGVHLPNSPPFAASPPTSLCASMLLQGQLQGQSGSSAKVTSQSPASMDDKRSAQLHPCLPFQCTTPGIMDRRIQSGLGRAHSLPPSFGEVDARGSLDAHQPSGGSSCTLLDRSSLPFKVQGSPFH